MKIFGTVFSALKMFIKEYHPKEITFSAQIEENEDDSFEDKDTSRSSLYDRFISRLSREYKITHHKTYNGYAFKYSIVFD